MVNLTRADQMFGKNSINCPAIASTRLTGHKVPRVVS